MMKTYLIMALLLVSAASSAWAEAEWKASLGVSEEFNDNTGEDHEGEEDFVTSLRPSLSYFREGSRLQFQSSYRGNYHFYAKGTEDKEFNHDLNVHALLDAWENFFFLEATEIYRLVNQDRTKGDVQEEDSTTDLVQQNKFTFSPYIIPHFGERTLAKMGYAFSDIRYEDDNGDSKSIHRGFVDGEHELSSKASLLTGYSYTRELWEEETLDRQIAYVGGRYEYAQNGNVFLKIGPQYTRYQERDDSATSTYWDAGLEHDFGAVRLGLSTGVTFEDDPDTGETYERKFATVRLSKAWQRTTAMVYTTLEDYDEGADGSGGRRRDDNETGDSVLRTALGLRISHDFTARLSGTLGLMHDFEDDTQDDTKRWYANLGLNYALSETMGLGWWYRFKDSSSNDSDEDYKVSRVGVQLTMYF